MAKMSFLRSLLVVYLAACLVYESIALAAHSNNGGKKQGLKYRRPERKVISGFSVSRSFLNANKLLPFVLRFMQFRLSWLCWVQILLYIVANFLPVASLFLVFIVSKEDWRTTNRTVLCRVENLHPNFCYWLSYFNLFDFAKSDCKEYLFLTSFFRFHSLRWRSWFKEKFCWILSAAVTRHWCIKKLLRRKSWNEEGNWPVETYSNYTRVIRRWATFSNSIGCTIFQTVNINLGFDTD